MVEVDDPREYASTVAERLGLPFAWPLMEKDDYTSMGVNFGDINIEFIHFRTRFGVRGTSFKGFSGIAFKVEDSLEEASRKLEDAEIHYRTGEENQAHTTITVEEERVFPTLFLVKYHFDTSGWDERLRHEFTECSGGTFNIGRFRSLSINQVIPGNMAGQFQIIPGNKNQLVFESASGETAVISDLIENLELVIA